MANILGIFAAVFLIGASFFSIKNKAALADQERILSEQEDTKNRNVKHFEEVDATYEDNEARRIAANEEDVKVSESLEKQEVSNKLLSSQIKTTTGDVEVKKEKVADGKEKLAKVGDLDDLRRKLDDLGVDLAELNSGLAQRANEIVARQTVKGTLLTENDRLEGILDKYTKRESLPGATARVARVLSDFDFVILSGGDNAGIVNESKLDVLRGGVVIGQLMVTTTTQNSAAANPVVDSFVGTAVRVGDTVVPAAN